MIFDTNSSISKMSACHDEAPVLKKAVFQSKMAGQIPRPPTFKTGFAGKVFTVPQYYPFEHSETQWILNMYRSNSWDRLLKVALLNPSYFRTSYFQLPDSPGPQFGQPMFHDKAVLYLTPLALAIYLNLDGIVKNLIAYRDQNGRRILSIHQPCYVTNVFINASDSINDLLQIHSPCILILRQSFDCVRAVLLSGKWSPLKPFCFLYRRPFKICKFSYKDIIDYTLSQLLLRSSLKVPQFLNSMIQSLSDEFSLLYYEQIICQYHQNSVEEWVSIPRRLLRFAFYYDKEMRLTSQILRCVQVFQQNSFFLGPTRSCFHINYRKRLCALKTNFHRKIGDPDETRVVLDQDNCFSLLLAMIQQASTFQHHIIKDKLISIIPAIANDTMWLLHFLVKKLTDLSHYFTNLIEKVDCIAEYVFIQVRAEILKSLEMNVIPIKNLKDLNLKPNEIICVRTILLQFAHQYGQHLGHWTPGVSWGNNSNEWIYPSESNEFLSSSDDDNLEELDNEQDEDELERVIKLNYDKRPSRKQRNYSEVSADVIRMLEERTGSK